MRKIFYKKGVAMKNSILIIALMASIISFQAESCPTCLGRIEKDSPPFFTDEFYKPTAESMDYLYQQLVADQEETVEETQENS
jgi:hypothetical protein